MLEAGVLVTGAGGFIGAALAEHLIAQGEPVVVMLRDHSRKAFPAHVPVIRGDVTDAALCRRALADYQVKTVYHLAANSIVSSCAEDPVGAMYTNVMGTTHLLQAVRDAGRPIRVVVMTSDKVYGKAQAPYTEDTPFEAEHAYEVSKACQDLAVRMYRQNYGLDATVVRAVNVYGPGDPNETRLIPRAVKRCLAGQAPVVHAGAAEISRQYLYVDDMVAALQIIARMGTRGAYCVGAPGAPLTVLEVIRAITAECGVEFVHELAARDVRFKEISFQSVDDTRLRGLGWTPRITFDVGIRQVVEHMRGQYEVR